MTNILAKTILKEMQEEIKAAGNLTKDVEALELAIKALEGTALEVPVQEQSKEIVINISNPTFSSEFADYMIKCLINYQYQMKKSSHH